MNTSISRSLFVRVFSYCAPLGLLLIMCIGIIGYLTINKYMDIAIERNLRIRSTVIARSLETFLDNRIHDILYLNQERIDRQSLLDFIERQARLDPKLYREAAFISSSPASSILYVQAQGIIRQIAPENFADVYPNPMHLPRNLHTLAEGEVFCTNITSIDFPFPAQNGVGNRMELKLFRLITPYTVPDTATPGYLVLGVDAQRLRNVLSQISTSKDKAWGFSRSNEVRFSYLFDTEGWILFQSEQPENKDKELSTYLARSGFLGTLGKPGLHSAFLPDKAYNSYWETVGKVLKEESGYIRLNDEGFHNSPEVSPYFMAYEPIRYASGKAGDKQRLFAGLVYIDRSKLAFDSRNAYLMVSMIWVIGAIFLLALFFFACKSMIVRPLTNLKQQIHARLRLGKSQTVSQAGGCRELDELAAVANELFRMIDLCEDRLENLSDNPMSEKMQEPLDLNADYQAALAMDDQFKDIIGTSAGQIELKSQILKAAAANVDIFIVGETGTGKQLVAEAIHNNSDRRNGPFVAINCGALNEDLLLDALFGHVKGAHSGAQGGRKGAFVESNGGTLFLDEIQAASPKVQQALLRAIAERKIRPLGSDTEINVDLRIVTATNSDLTQLIKDGAFREDLFYRLYVLAIQTLPLRNRKEDIPLLAYHYLIQTQEFVAKSNLLFSKGAIKKLLAHDWPGNVRELVNCITRTVVFAEGPVIQASDLRMEDSDMYIHEPADPLRPEQHPSGAKERGPNDQLNRSLPVRKSMPKNVVATKPQSPLPAPTKMHLSPRQRKALPHILERKAISRKEYQKIVGENLSARTANYDLNDMMQKGILAREGAGSTTHYRLAPKVDTLELKRMLAHQN